MGGEQKDRKEGMKIPSFFQCIGERMFGERMFAYKKTYEPLFI